MADKKHAPADRISRDTLTGDVRDQLLAFSKNQENPLPWAKLSEADQRALIDQATCAAFNLVQDVVEIVASEGRTAIRGLVAAVTVKGEIRATIVCEKTPQSLLDLCADKDQIVMLTVASVRPFDGERAPALADADQTETPPE